MSTASADHPCDFDSPTPLEDATLALGQNPAWNRLLASTVRVQAVVPEAIVVGGTAAAIHAQHRTSYDADHCVAGLAPRFAEVKARIEARPEWTTARVIPRKVILGSWDGTQTGIRNLIRSVPLESEAYAGPWGVLQVMTAGEALRVTAWLALRRNATLDYLDVVALWDHLGDMHAAAAFNRFDSVYQGDTQESSLKQVIVRLADPQPYDRDSVDLASSTGIVAHWRCWDAVVDACRRASMRIFDAIRL